MAYREMPDLVVPPSDVRCEAMTKRLKGEWQQWKIAPHRCVRRAMQGRDGRGVCAIHARVKKVTWWNGEPDAFRHKPFWKWRTRAMDELLKTIGGEK